VVEDVEAGEPAATMDESGSAATTDVDDPEDADPTEPSNESDDVATP